MGQDWEDRGQLAGCGGGNGDKEFSLGHRRTQAPNPSSETGQRLRNGEGEGKPLADRQRATVTMKELSSSCLLGLYEIHPLRQVC